MTTAEGIIDAAPCSVELSAGAGKTQIVAQLAAAAASRNGRTLVLTHTHAGVEAIRRRLRTLDVPVRAAVVSTIDAWALNLARHMPLIGQMSIPTQPDWAHKNAYCAAATRVVHARHTQRMLSLSYQLAIVDEYQDCSTHQHGIIAALRAAVPTVVLGDRLQALFGFEKDAAPVDWVADVLPLFPDRPVDTYPWRWHDTNQQLGAWLSEIRQPLLTNQPISLVGAPITWQQHAPVAYRTAAVNRILNQQRNGSLIAIGHFRNDLVVAARGLKGRFQVMEPLYGSTAEEFCRAAERDPGPDLACAVAAFVKNCIANASSVLTSQRLQTLQAGKSIKVKDPNTAALVAPFNILLSQGDPVDVLAALDAGRKIPGGFLYCTEVWHEVRAALELASREPDCMITNQLAQARSRTGRRGRRAHRRAVGTPLLIKGLEYDHAVLLDADGYTASELYVALSRARVSTTVLSKSSTLTPKRLRPRAG